MINLGLIGCGTLARAAHCTSIAKNSDAQFIAYADIDEAAAKAALRDFGGEYAIADVGQVLSDTRVSAVYICTRHDSHAPLAIAAARAGKHILIEKPLALTTEACEAIAEAVKQVGHIGAGVEFVMS